MRPPVTPIKVFGGTYPAQIWQRFMSTALADQPTIPFHDPPVPATVPARPPAGSGPPTTQTGPAVAVPDVTGMHVGDATAALKARGFVVATYPTDGVDAPPGTVTTQSPPADQDAPKGSTVILEVAA